MNEDDSRCAETSPTVERWTPDSAEAPQAVATICGRARQSGILPYQKHRCKYKFVILRVVLKPRTSSLLTLSLTALLVSRAAFAQEPAPPPVPDAVVALQVAAMNGDLRGITSAVDAHVAVDALGESHMTALGIASMYGRLDALRALLKAGASVAVDQDGESILAVAAHEGHTEVMEALIAAGADVNAKNKDGISPLMVAAGSNRVGAVRTLVAKGADVNAVNNDGATALIASAYGGYAPATDALLSGGAKTDVRDRAGRTALMASALGGNAAVTSLLLEHKADPLVEDNNDMNALVYAASTGQDEVVAVLRKAGVTRGADLALAFAVRGCRLPLAVSLLSGGASLDADLNGDHLLILAVGANCRDGIEMLLSKGMNIDKPNDEGMTALMRAAGEGYVELVELLLAKGADMELQNKNNQSAWLFAAMGNHPEIVELLRANREARQKK